ncbi:GNAT family N-acetyltransferase [Neptuniibacter sp.]|uniref:GNAT family N-acetyltransferase n=1 Tax=Neptuniibacter sp. TaxID=1962643 RepID=UPI002613649C|nr:GNAT family N-acetyltransferase [Neptuniibacter sp.]MCP4597756.1 GNAT family N-acetyltransferase [Neptuniibacter sp.]
MYITIRPLASEDFNQWKVLFEGYCDFYEHPADETKVLTEWNWLHDEKNMLKGLVACDAVGNIMAFAHYHAWPISIFGSEVCYLSDLYTLPSYRKKGAAKALYNHLIDLCKENSWPALTLLTQENNTTAQSLYNQFGEASDFKFYISPIAS